MPRSLNEQLQRLQRLNGELRRDLEESETFIPKINDAIRQLESIGITSSTIILGEVVFDRTLSAASQTSDESQVIQAVIFTPVGLGAIVWDRETYLACLRARSFPESEAATHFMAFEDLAPALRALLLPQAPAAAGPTVSDRDPVSATRPRLELSVNRDLHQGGLCYGRCGKARRPIKVSQAMLVNCPRRNTTGAGLLFQPSPRSKARGLSRPRFHVDRIGSRCYIDGTGSSAILSFIH